MPEEVDLGAVDLGVVEYCEMEEGRWNLEEEQRNFLNNIDPPSAES